MKWRRALTAAMTERPRGSRMAEDTLDLKGKPWRHVLVVSLCTLALCLVACTLLMFVLWFNQAGAFADTPASMPVFTGLLCGGFVGGVFIWVFYTDQPAPSGTGTGTEPEIETVIEAPASTPTSTPAVPSARRGRHRWVSMKVPGDELDQDLWAQLDREARRRLRRRLRKRRPRQLALRVAMAPFAAVGFTLIAVLAAQQWMDVLPDALVLTLAPVLGVIGAGYFIFSRIRSTVRMWRGDVYVVTGRVQGTESGEAVGEEAAAMMATNYVTAELSHETIQILLADGGLADPETDLTRGDLSARFSSEALGSGVDRPPHLLVRCSRSVGSRLADGDATVLLCLGDGRAVALVRDLELTRLQRRNHRKARARARRAAQRPPPSPPQPSGQPDERLARGRHRAGDRSADDTRAGAGEPEREPLSANV